ncbi:LOW QUALITY PROTEIN: hypothetical protein KUTeg_017924 [Tegillarca granosa]|uniref:HAT C-terminal dimerisation domain-containing protein n=1 Tax=Tegillarca granosa TaxID=220873 RepID=A0ABQ9EGE4_TEGGR|nr:LOW QUALITY PROTEIN: hypothetical protein KUTeg_017924 [Tegillarca granosa]
MLLRDVVTVFLEEGLARALSYHKPIVWFKFLYTAHFLADVLKQLSILCRAYQSPDIDFVESTVEVLRRLRDSESGDNLVQFCEMAPPEPVVDEMGACSFQFRALGIVAVRGQRQAVSACEIFVSNVIGNLNRFTEKGVVSILCDLSQFFSPSCIVDAVEEDIVSEVVSYLEINCKLYTSSKETVQLVLKNRAIFPIFAAAAERLLVIPVSTVDCERRFSLQNLTKTDIRNSLVPEHLIII